MATIKPTFTVDKINEYLKKYRNITFKAGVYNITKMMICPSNTHVTCEPGVIFKRSCRYQMLEMEASEDVTEYDGTHDVIWDGGLFAADQREENAIVIVLYHCRDITLKNITVDGCRGYHSIECNSSCDIHIEDCVFKNQSIIEGAEYREAIQIDFAYDLGYPYRGKKGNPASDGTHCRNIYIIGCTFDNVPNGIGTHTVYKEEKYHENIHIVSCKFGKVLHNDIQLLGMKNVDVLDVMPGTSVYVGKRDKGYKLTGDKAVKLAKTRYNINVYAEGVSIE